MKKYSILFLISIIFLASCKENVASKIKSDNLVKAQERDLKLDTEVPVMSFDKKDFDFGTINENDVVETVFNFTNTGKTDLIITNASATCGCTIPEWPKEPIKPGGVGTIKVKFNSRGKKNKQNKTVTLSTNTRDGKELLKITAQVTPAN
ncbi:MAG: DUF1573 domain-containing protein [Flavobacteriales bacterium]|mgnify:CR=1 FL=1|nr:DUF1573 domain-containing protein [Flavobacteriales bacterium]